jgi:hypothetical protein
MLLRGIIDADALPGVRDACVRVFELRRQHDWPPTLDVPRSWSAPYAQLAGSLEFEIVDVDAAAMRVRELIHELDAVGDS